MDNRTTSSDWLRGVAEALNGAGLDVRALFRDAGLDFAGLQDSDARYPTEQISKLWELAVQRSGNHAIGLSDLDSARRPSCFGVVGYAMMSCANLLASLEHLVSYLRIVSGATRVELIEEADGYWVVFSLYDGGYPVPRQRFDFSMQTFLVFCRWLTGRELHPLAVEYCYPAPADLQAHHDAFRCPVHFGKPANRILLSHADLGEALPTANPLMAQLHERYASERLGRLQDASLSARVRELIIKRLSGREPSRQDIASELCLSERTLQRRLQEEHTTFQQVLDDTRRELARQYLKQREVSLLQASFLLGFSDQSAFSHAFKRWFGVTPGSYRERLLGEA